MAMAADPLVSRPRQGCGALEASGWSGKPPWLAASGFCCARPSKHTVICAGPGGKSAAGAPWPGPPGPDQDAGRIDLSGCGRHLQEGRSLGTLTADVQLHAQHGSLQFHNSSPGWAGPPCRGSRRNCCASMFTSPCPRSLSQAEQVEMVLSTWPAQQKASAPQPRIRVTGYDEEEEEEEEETEEVCQVWPPSQWSQRWPSPSKLHPPQATDRCNLCDEPGHIACDWLATARATPTRGKRRRNGSEGADTPVRLPPRQITLGHT